MKRLHITAAILTLGTLLYSPKANAENLPSIQQSEDIKPQLLLTDNVDAENVNNVNATETDLTQVYPYLQPLQKQTKEKEQLMIIDGNYPLWLFFNGYC